MAELRTDPIFGNQVIVAPARGNRPGAFAPPVVSPTLSSQPCPFCPGNEDQTPNSLLDKKDAGTQDWSLRVVPNLYPATIPDFGAATDATTDVSAEPRQVFSSRPNLGRHEVVIESRQHVSQFTQLSALQAELVFQAYVDRFRSWQTESPPRFGLAFKNNGRQAGASIPHVHSQLVALDFLPNWFQQEWEIAERRLAQAGTCAFCEWIEQELDAGSRVVDQDEEFVVVCPFASRMPYEMWILPRRHSSHFDRAPVSLIQAAAKKTHAMLTRLTQIIENAPYNYLIHSAPFDMPDTGVYHWHVEVIPRIAKLAGFEWGTGCHINPVSPEQAALQLRSV